MTSFDTRRTRSERWQTDEKCDMLYMLVCLRDDVWQSKKLKDEQKLHYIAEAVPAITSLMKEVVEDKETLRMRQEMTQRELQG